MAPNMPAIDIEDFFSIFLVNVNDNGTGVERAEWLDEYQNGSVLTLNGKLKVLEWESNGFRAWLLLPLCWVFLFLLY